MQNIGEVYLLQDISGDWHVTTFQSGVSATIGTHSAM